MDRSNNLSAFRAFSGLLRTVVLICSPFPNVGAKWKNLILFLRVRRDPDALEAWQRYFDAAYYLRTHPDVRDSGIDPCVHFLISGAAERRSPSRDFDVNDYLESYPDVARSGLNPLLHLALFGSAEGRLATQLLTPTPTPAATGEDPPERVVMVENPLVIRNTWIPDVPLVSVVIPCFNYGRFLAEAIRSVLNQTFQDFEIIVVEGGSTKLESVEETRRLESTADSRVRFYYRTEPHLVGDNRNFGIARARGRYICCLDADDRIAPLYLEIAVFLTEAFGYDLVYPSLQGFGDSDVRWKVNDATFPDIVDWNQVTTTALFRKAAWAHVGGYRDWGLGGEHVPEDWDFWIRLVGHGFATKSIHEMMLLYRVHGSGLTSTCDGDLDRQRRALRDANRVLLEHSTPLRHLRRQVIEPLENLLPKAQTDAQPGFLLALPFITLGGAERLLSRVGQHIMDSGQRLVVTTSLILSSAIPEYNREFERLTSQVYHLRKLFQDDEHARAFYKYLIRRYNIKTLMLTGCEFTYSLLPELKDEFPELRVIDQLFNDTVHVPKNRKYDPWIDATVAPSAAVLDSLVTRFNADKDKIHIIPHGVEIPESIDAPGPVTAVNSSAALKQNVTVAFFGRLSPEKAPDVFVRIAHKLSGREDLSFIMTGDGPERNAVQSLIKKCKLESRLNCLGFVDDLEPYLRAADIVVLTSRLDGMPLIVLEAQARGKAVVASRIGSLPHMIEHGETGFLCEPENVAEFCASILRLADDAALRRKIGLAARQSALRHGESKMFERYDAVFQPAAEIAMAQAQP